MRRNLRAISPVTRADHAPLLLFSRHVLDETRCSTITQAVMNGITGRFSFGVRLRYSDGLLLEAEAQLVPEVLAATALDTIIPMGADAFVAQVPQNQRMTRDELFAFAQRYFDSVTDISQLDSWLGTVAFAGQIFCDFAGYTTCAIGASLCFGFFLVDNFHFPYAAVGLRDFWRRWHMSLSTWLRDYLYVPLGGNRHGLRRMQLALMLTMVSVVCGTAHPGTSSLRDFECPE